MIQKDLKELMGDVEKDLSELMFGSIELFVQDGEITQVTVRRIKKTGSTTHSKVNFQKEESNNSVNKYPKA